MDDILAVLRKYRFGFSSEAALQSSIETVLTSAGIVFEREVQLSSSDRIDFLCGDIGIEVKIDGSANKLSRQVMRYLRSPQLSGIIVVTSKASHHLPESLDGKRIERVWLSGL